MKQSDFDQNSEVQHGKYHIWRYLFVTVAIVVMTLVAQTVLIFLASIIEGNFDVMQYPPLTLLWVSLLPFAALLITQLIGIKVIHSQPLKEVFTQKDFFSKKLLIKAFGLWFLLSGLSDIVLAVLQPENYSFTFDPNSFFLYMLIAVVLLFIQISAEEILFRHYFLFGFLRLFRKPWIAIVSQAILFGFLHGANPEVTAYGFLTTMPYYIGMGLILGWLTLRSKGLEIALGVHFANNLYATSMVTFKESAIPSPALFTINQYQPELGLLIFGIMITIFSLIIAPTFKNLNDKYFHSGIIR